MKRWTRAIVGSILIAAVGIAGVVHTEFLGKGSKKALAETEYFVNAEGKIKMPKTLEDHLDPEKKVGASADNPFFVLEIVPNVTFAEIGYQIGGCEPLDMRVVALDGQVWLDSSSGVLKKSPNAFVGYWKSELPASYTKTSDQVQETTLPHLGKMEKTPGSGNYEYNSGFKPKTNGGYTFTSLSVEEVYKMLAGERNAYVDISSAPEGAGKVSLGSETAYYNSSSGSIYVSENNFLKYAVGLAYDYTKGKRKLVTDEAEIERRVNNYHRVVYTVTPEDLNMNLELIDVADMIVISSQCATFNSVQSSFDKYCREDLFSHAPTGYGPSRLEKTVDGQLKRPENFTDNPISWDAVKRIYARACGVYGNCPIITDTQSRSNAEGSLTGSNAVQIAYADGTPGSVNVSGSRDNMWKLIMLLLQMEPATFCQMYKTMHCPVCDKEIQSGTYCVTCKKDVVPYAKVLDGANFGEAPLKDSSGNVIRLKDNTVMTTGTFVKGQEVDVANSKYGVMYWNWPMFYPYHLAEYSTNGGTTNANVSAVADMLGIANSSTPYQYLHDNMQYGVVGSTYTYVGNTTTTAGFHRDTMEGKASVIAVKDNHEYGKKVYDFIENATEATPGKSARPSAVDTADVLWYLLNHSNSELDDPNGPIEADLKILALESSGTSKTFTKKEEFLSALLAAQANFRGNLTIDYMTTSEFIGKKVDVVSEYDMVYISAELAPNVYGLPGGFAYAHSGAVLDFSTNGKEAWENRPVYVLRETVNGWFGGFISDNDQKNLIASGNDLTELALTKLVDFKKAGLPIMFGSGFFTSDDLSGADVSKSIDRRSNLYRLLKEYRSGGKFESALYEDAFKVIGSTPESVTKWNKERVKFRDAVKAAVKNKVWMDFDENKGYSMPVEYNDMAATAEENLANFINPKSNDSKTLVFKFKLNGPADATEYKLRLCIDNNGDGNFTAEGERVQPEVRELTSGQLVGTDSLVAGKEYKVSYEVDERSGSVHWKLELYKGNVIYASVSKLSAIKKHDGQTKLTILQIIPGTNAEMKDRKMNVNGKLYEIMSEDEKYVYLPDANDIDEWKGNDSAQLTSAQYSKNGESTVLFMKYMYNADGSSRIDGLDMQFVRMSEEDIISEVSQYKTNPTGNDYYKFFKNGVPGADQSVAGKGGFGMIVCGFSDAYAGVMDGNVLDGLKEYMDNGFAVLLTHDTTNLNGEYSYYADHQYGDMRHWFFGSSLTDRFRSSLGMERYSLLLDGRFLGAGVNVTGRRDYPWKTSDSNDNRSVAGENLNLSGSSYIAAQGISNAVLLKFYSGLSNVETNRIKVVNHGAVSSYPYKISEYINVAPTHPQYFQLDMENEDINVWYTLDTAQGDTYKITDTLNRWDGEEKITQIKNYYEGMSGDVRNNYYIYNINNVTYSGVGHSGTLKDDEVKLFVNTFVAAYRAPAKQATVVVTNPDAVTRIEGDGQENYFLAVDFNSTVPDVAIGNLIVDGYKLRTISNGSGGSATYTEDGTKQEGKAKRVYFYIRYGGEKYTITTSVPGITVGDKDLAIYQVTKKDAYGNPAMDGSDGTFVKSSEDLKPGKSYLYYVDVPLTIESSGANKAIGTSVVEFTTTPWHKTNGGFVEPPDGPLKSIVTISPRGRFDLD